MIHPIQPETMDIVQLKREFDGRLTLCGGIRTQDFLGKGGGYILEPGITLQDDVPRENLAAVIEGARI